MLGPVAGSICGGIAAVATSPYPLRLRYDRGTLREYFSFSWPLLAASASGLVIVQAVGADRQLHRRPRRARGARARDHLLDVRRPARLADPADDLPGGVRGQGPHRAAVRGVREVEPAGADVGVSVRRRAGAVRPRPDQLRARRALARGGGPAAGVRAHDRRPPGRLQLGDLLLGDRRQPPAGGLELRPARGLRRGHRAADDRLRPQRLRGRDGGRRLRRPRRPRLLPRRACSRASRSGATWSARSPRASRRRSRSSLLRALTDVDRTLGLAIAELGLYVALTVVSTIAFERSLLGRALRLPAPRGARRARPGLHRRRHM